MANDGSFQAESYLAKDLYGFRSYCIQAIYSKGERKRKKHQLPASIPRRR